MAKIRLQGDDEAARSISDVMGSISEVLTTSEELLTEGDSDHEVAVLVTSFLKTLLVQLDDVLVSQDRLGHLEGGTVSGRARNHMDCTSTTCLVGSLDCPHHKPKSQATAWSVGKTSRPIANKYDATCTRCRTRLTAGQGYVLPSSDPNARKKWHAFCDPCYLEVTA